jgi:hypothetical protein
LNGVEVDAVDECCNKFHHPGMQVIIP